MAIKTFIVGLFFAIDHLCKYFVRYQLALTQFIEASSLTSDQKSFVITWLDNVVSVCALVKSISGGY